MKYAERVEESTLRPEIHELELTRAGKLEREYRMRYTELGRREGVELGRREGVELGRRKGELEANRRLLLKLASTRVGDPPERFAQWV